jgi:biofilm protein TabA
MKKLLLSIAFTGLLTIVSTKVSAQAKTEVKEVSADKWFAGHQYLAGLAILPNPATNTIEFARQYRLNKVVWDKVFAYLKNTDLAGLAPGKYPIEGTALFAAVTDNPTKTYDNTTWESHRKNIDLQCVVQGVEKMAVAPITTAKVTEPYNDAKDVAHYEAEGKLYEAKPGTFFLFFPSDVHRVNIVGDGADHDKKVVIKINVVD